MPSTLGRRKKPAMLSAPAVALTNANDGLLPTDLLYEVLLRLPAKELCRLRLVCRSWRSLTSDPGFAKAHGSRHPPLVAGIWNNTEVHLLDLSCCNNIVRRLHVPQRFRQKKHVPQPVYDLSTDRGLLRVSPEEGCLSYVLDPATGGVVAAIPNGAYNLQQQRDGSFRPVPLEPVPDHASFNWPTPSMFGYVPSTGEYKALLVTVYNYTNSKPTCNVITVGAAAAGGKIRWRARACPPVVSTSCHSGWVAIDGVAYLLSRSSYNYTYNYTDIKYSDHEPDAIFAFDLTTEEWRPNILRGPLSTNNSDSELKFSRKRENLQLLALDGCLVMAHHKNLDCSMDVWFLVDMDIDRGLWNKRYSIRCVPRCAKHSSRPPFPLHVFEDGRIVIWGVEKERAVYDPRTNTYAKLASNINMEEYTSVRMHFGSLLCSSGLQS